MQRRWLKFALLAAAVVAIVMVNRFYLTPLPADQAIGADSVAIEIPKEPSVLYGMVVDNRVVIEDKIKRHEVLGDILEQYNVPAKLIHQVSQLSRSIFDVRKIAPDKKYTLICDQDSAKTAMASCTNPIRLNTSSSTWATPWKWMFASVKYQR